VKQLLIREAREFINNTVFDKRWNELNLTDDDLRLFQLDLLENPKAGKIMEGTGGAAKVRYAVSGKGKSGGVRVIYLDLESYGKIYLLTCYPKSLKDNLSDKEKAAIKEVIKRILKREKEGLQ
jgi:hypothetical protein